jgi:toxin-antitoxin system PIN domain toxin
VHLLDVNVLVYAFQPGSPRHDEWRAWLDGCRRSAFCVPDEVALGFVRIVTNRRVFDPPATVPEASAMLEALRASPGWRSLVPPPSRWTTFASLCEATSARGADVPDAWLAALAIDTGATLVSADRGFARFPGLRWLHPLS